MHTKSGKKYKIKKGAKVYQDFLFRLWPDLPNVENEDMLFDEIIDFKFKTKNAIYLVADGFGAPENYGNGLIIVYNENGVEECFH